MSADTSTPEAVTGRWDPERREFIIGVGHHALHVTDMALDDWRYDLDHLAAEFAGGRFKGPEFERVRDGLRPGYDAMQGARTALRWSAICSAIDDLIALSTLDGDGSVFERLLTAQGYRIVRSRNHG